MCCTQSTEVRYADICMEEKHFPLAWLLGQCAVFVVQIVSTSTVTIVQVHVGKVQLGDYSFLYYLSTSEVHRSQYYSTKSCIAQWEPGVGLEIEEAWSCSSQILASSYSFYGRWWWTPVLKSLPNFICQLCLSFGLFVFLWCWWRMEILENLSVKSIWLLTGSNFEQRASVVSK